MEDFNKDYFYILKYNNIKFSIEDMGDMEFESYYFVYNDQYTFTTNYLQYKGNRHYFSILDTLKHLLGIIELK